MYNLNLQHVGDNSVNHSPLKPEPRGTMILPLTRKSFVVKPDGSQTLRPRKSGNVLPFLVTLQNLNRHCARELLVNATVLFDWPHATLCICHEWYVKSGDRLVTDNVKCGAQK